MDGGVVFVSLVTLFEIVGQKEAQLLNLILFLFVGMSASISNIKAKMIDKSIVKKMILLMLIGGMLGTYLVSIIDENNLKLYFNLFLVIIGIYEIISSLIELKKAKNKYGT